MSFSVVFSGNVEEDACVGEASVVFSGNGEEDACNKGEEAPVVVSGKRKNAVKRTCTAVEYPCVRRLRERRLLSFLQDQGYRCTFEALIAETPALFSVLHIRRLVKLGRWEDALMYLNAYLPPLAENHKRSRRAQIFHYFLLMHYRFANAVAGNREKSLDKHYASGRWCSSHADLRFRSVTYPILAAEPHELKATYDWDKVRGHASFLVYILAHTTPELRRSMPLPPSRYMRPQHVLPIGGSGFHRRRHHVVKKQGPQLRNTDAILMALKSQHHCNLHGNSSAKSPTEAMEMLVDFLDQTLQAGLRRGCNLSYATQTPSAIFRMVSQPIVKEGTNKRSGQAGCHSENPNQGPTTTEDDIYQKKQRTTRAFGEASSVSVFGVRASTDTGELHAEAELSRACSL